MHCESHKELRDGTWLHCLRRNSCEQRVGAKVIVWSRPSPARVDRVRKLCLKSMSIPEIANEYDEASTEVTYLRQLQREIMETHSEV